MTALEVVGAVLDVLERLHVDYMLVGSFSSNLYGTPRMTKDADFVLQASIVPVTAIAAALGSDFRLDPQITFETVTGTTRYRIEHGSTRFVVEFFELSADAHDQQRFARRREAALAGRAAFVPTAEDVVITKLRWSKQGARPKDVDDVANVLAVQRDALDLSYIRHWADLHGTRELFEKLWAASLA